MLPMKSSDDSKILEELAKESKKLEQGDPKTWYISASKVYATNSKGKTAKLPNSDAVKQIMQDAKYQRLDMNAWL